MINENEPDIETLNLSINKRIDELREVYKQLLKERLKSWIWLWNSQIWQN
ncbi:hypothetical protein HYE01_02410 [Mycoplasmopsis bovis]|nr:hypothetical protein HYE11_02340 [Mycoplasmopsis bovis]QQH28475.1 hypothetical protein HYE01_02410 [Mycoplasmopsis bovis]QQH49126.1 hypothetical protein HYD74_02365 [Mycoplasmopsis bovis]